MIFSPSRPRPYRLSGDSTKAGEAAAGRLARVPKTRRERIAELTGCPHSDAASLIDHLSRQPVAAQILRSLSPRGVMATRLFVEAQDLLPAAVAESTGRERLGDAWPGARDEMDGQGILFESTWAGGARLVGLLPPLARSMRPFLWLLGDVAEAGSLEPSSHAERASIGLAELRSLVLVLAAVATDPPRQARDGSAHASDLSRIHAERLEPVITGLEELQSHVNRLFSLGLLAGDGEGRVRVRWKRAEALIGLPSSSRLPLLLSTDEPGPPASSKAGISPARTRRLLCSALADLPPGMWARRSAVEAAVRLRLLAADTTTPYGDLRKTEQRATAQVRFMTGKLVRCLELHRTEDGEEWLRLPVAADAESGHWLVQPDHEIIVPPEVADLDLLRLASLADLKRADTVAQLHIGPESVGRAVASGLTWEAILERLSFGSARQLPEGLDLQIRDWVREAGEPLAGRLTADEEAESFFESSKEGANTAPGSPPHRTPQPPSIPKGAEQRFSPEVASVREEFQELALESSFSFSASS